MHKVIKNLFSICHRYALQGLFTSKARLQSSCPSLPMFLKRMKNYTKERFGFSIQIHGME